MDDQDDQDYDNDQHYDEVHEKFDCQGQERCLEESKESLTKVVAIFSPSFRILHFIISEEEKKLFSNLLQYIEYIE